MGAGRAGGKNSIILQPYNPSGDSSLLTQGLAIRLGWSAAAVCCRRASSDRLLASRMSSWAIVSSCSTRGRALFELALSRKVFELRRHATGHRGKRRHHPAKLVSGLAQPCRVPLPQGILNCRQMIRQASPKCLTDLLQDDGVAPAGGQEHTRVEQAWSRSVGWRARTPDDAGRSPPTGRRPGSAWPGNRPCRPQGTARGLLSASAPSRQ